LHQKKKKRKKEKNLFVKMVYENNAASDHNIGVHRVSHINVYQENRRQARQVSIVVAEYSPITE
jgi:hypothetical protein